MTEPSLVSYSCENLIATITLTRPEKLNAVSDETVRQLGAALRKFDADKNAYVAILCGQGRAFSSGADVKQRQLRSPEEMERVGGVSDWDAKSGELLTRANNWKPVIAAVHGYVLGLAFGTMLDCDLIVAEEGTVMQLTETSRGLGGAKQWRQLQMRNSGAFGDEVAFTGRRFTAEEALKYNIINRVAPKGKYMDVAHELATAVAANPPLAVRATIRERRWILGEVTREAEARILPLKLHLTEDLKEAASAFMEKRKPRGFQGR